MRNKWKLIEEVSNMKLIWALITSSNAAIDLFHMYNAFFVSQSIIKIAREFDGLSMSTLI